VIKTILQTYYHVQLVTHFLFYHPDYLSLFYRSRDSSVGTFSYRIPPLSPYWDPLYPAPPHQQESNFLGVWDGFVPQTILYQVLHRYRHWDYQRRPIRPPSTLRFSHLPPKSTPGTLLHSIRPFCSSPCLRAFPPLQVHSKQHYHQVSARRSRHGCSYLWVRPTPHRIYCI
jgi:hypothetical protein